MLNKSSHDAQHVVIEDMYYVNTAGWPAVTLLSI